MHILPISAKDAPALRASARLYAAHLEATDDDLPAICRSASTRRSHFRFGTAVVAEDKAEMQRNLERLAVMEEFASARQRRKPRIAFLFTGQGSQYREMGRGLFDTEPVFRETMQQCDEMLRDELPVSLLSVMFSSDEDGPSVDDTRYTQPALFALEVALLRLWQSWGISPDVVIGHSVGEFAAAHAAGVLSLEDATRLVALRARLMAEAPGPGAMASISAPGEIVAVALQPFQDRVSIAAVNTPRSVVVSGEAASIERLINQFVKKGVRAQRLVVSHAFHSPLMDPILDAFARQAATFTVNEPSIPLISNVTGELLGPVRMDADYWRRHLRAPVQFRAGMAALGRLDVDCVIEIGPRPLLTVAGRQCLPDMAPIWLPSLKGGPHEDSRTIRQSLAALYSAGADINWETHYGAAPEARDRLPSYPFQRRRHWSGSVQPWSAEAPATKDERPKVQPAVVATAIDDFVLGIVARMAGKPGNEIDPASRLHDDLGFDSIMFIGLVTDLSARFPDVANRLTIADLFNNTTVGGIIAVLKENAELKAPACDGQLDLAVQHRFETWSRDFQPNRRIDRKLVHKTFDPNVLIGRVEQVAEHAFIGEVTQDPTHEFFYEHPQDHVPGLYLIEAARQYGTVITHLYYHVPIGRPFVLMDLNVKFQWFVETSSPLFIDARVGDCTHANGELTSMKCVAWFVQNGRRVGSVSGVFRVFERGHYNSVRSLPEAGQTVTKEQGHG